MNRTITVADLQRKMSADECLDCHLDLIGSGHGDLNLPTRFSIIDVQQALKSKRDRIGTAAYLACSQHTREPIAH